MLGSILSRAVAGASPFIATSVGCLAFVLIHRLLASLSFRYERFGNLIKGDKVVLYEDGKHLVKNMEKTDISHKDLSEEIRIQLHKDDLTSVQQIIIERNGRISIIKKDG